MGDLIIGKRNLTAIGTLVERTTGFTMLLHLPDGSKPEQVRDALAAKIQDHCCCADRQDPPTGYRLRPAMGLLPGSLFGLAATSGLEERLRPAAS